MHWGVAVIHTKSSFLKSKMYTEDLWQESHESLVMTKQHLRKAFAYLEPKSYLQINVNIKDKMTNCANRCGIPGLGSDQQRLRLVVMGDSFVGKSAIIKRFLFGRFVRDREIKNIFSDFNFIYYCLINMNTISMNDNS